MYISKDALEPSRCSAPDCECELTSQGQDLSNCDGRAAGLVETTTAASIPADTSLSSGHHLLPLPEEDTESTGCNFFTIGKNVSASNSRYRMIIDYSHIYQPFELKGAKRLCTVQV